MRAGLHRPTLGTLVAGLLVAGLVGTPTTARAEEPTVSTDGGTVTYTDPALEDAATTTVEGVLREVVVEAPASDGAHDDHAGHGEAETSHVVVTDDGDVVPVALAEEVGVSDAPVTAELVEGPALDAALDGRSSRDVQVASADVQRSSTAAAATSSHRVYVAVVDNSGDLSASSSTVASRVDSGLEWWRTEGGSAVTSYARSGSVQRYSSSLSTTNRCFGSPSSLWTEAAKQFPGVSFSANGNHLVVVVGAGCSGVGVGTLGRGMASGGQVILTESSSVFTSTLVHELGHNHGLEHANHEQAGEYWDLYSPMGLAVSGAGPTTLGTERRDQLGLTGSGEVAVVGRGQGGTFTLAPRSATSGLRGLQVVVGSTTYWVEWRSGTGRDASSYYPKEPNSYVSQTNKYPRGVTITSRSTGGTGSTVLRTRASGSQRLGSRAAGEDLVVGDVSIRVDEIGSSTATVTVTNGATGSELLPMSASTPTTSGTPKVGSTLTAVPGSWTSGTSFAYQWLLDGSAVGGATSSTWKLPASAHGRKVTVQVVGTRTGYTSATRTSAARTVAAGTLKTAKPTISGTRKVGSRLTASTGTWTSGTTFSYRWYANGKAISGATGPAYTPTKGVKGKKVQVKVHGKLAGYSSATVWSSKTGTIK